MPQEHMLQLLPLDELCILIAAELELMPLEDGKDTCSHLSGRTFLSMLLKRESGAEHIDGWHAESK